MLTSEQQLQLLRLMARADRLSKAELIDLAVRLKEFFDKRPKDEELDPRWGDYWRLHRSRFGGIIPTDVATRLVRLLDKVLKKNSSARQRESRTPLKPDERVAVLVGSGASAPPPSNIPTLNRLLPELWAKARGMRRLGLDPLETWCNAQGLTNIEDLLTAAHIADFCVTNNNITKLLGYFFSPPNPPTSGHAQSVPVFEASASITLLQDRLESLFLLLTSTMLHSPPNQAHKAIVRLLQLHPKTSIITTNYDGCMDEAILTARVSASMGPDLNGSGDAKPELIKVHGSINWTYCEKCQAVKELELLKLKREVAQDAMTFAVTSACRCGGERRPFLVPPRSFKSVTFPVLISLWNTARARIEQASVLLVVGYAFAEADTYISKVIARSLAVNSQQRMVVVDINGGLVPSLRKRFKDTIDDFNLERITAVRGDCAQELPQVVDGLVGNQREG